MEGARGVLLSIAGGSDLGLFEINDAAELVSDCAHTDANIIFGAVIDDALGEEARVTVIAAGFDTNESEFELAQPSRISSGVPEPEHRPEPAAEPEPQRESSVPEPRKVLFDDVDVPDFLKHGS